MVQRNPSAATKLSAQPPFAFGGDGPAEAAAKASLVGLRNAGRVQAEAMRFAAERLAKDIEMPARFACCQSVESLLEEQWKFTATMMKDYSAEGGRLLDLLTADTSGDAGEPSSK
jgi:hypothetical protein